MEKFWRCIGSDLAWLLWEKGEMVGPDPPRGSFQPLRGWHLLQTAAKQGNDL